MIQQLIEAGQGPALILLHGFPLDRSMWANQLAELSSRYRVITPDLSGHGGTPLSAKGQTIDGLADDVITLLDQLGLVEPVVVGGLSMGGYVALALVVRYPNRLRGLILMNTRAGADAPETARVREDLARAVETAGNSAIVVQMMLPKLFAPTTYRTQPAIVEAIRKVMAASSAAGVAATSRALAVRPSRLGDLASIKVPTLVIAGSDDQLIPLSESQAMAEAIAGSELVIIPDSGHLSPLENPTATNAAILGFLGRLA